MWRAAHHAKVFRKKKKKKAISWIHSAYCISWAWFKDDIHTTDIQLHRAINDSRNGIPVPVRMFSSSRNIPYGNVSSSIWVNMKTPTEPFQSLDPTAGHMHLLHRSLTYYNWPLNLYSHILFSAPYRNFVIICLTLTFDNAAFVELNFIPCTHF